MKPESPGRYQILRPLGSGGMGQVFLARLTGPEGFSKLVVIKRIRPELAHRDDFQELFTAEARLAAALDHPHIVSVLDFGRDDAGYYLAMEYVDGCDLGRLVGLAKARGLAMPPEVLVTVGLALCRALDYAQRRTRPVIHGDVNPQNVLAGRQGQVKLADFGLAALAGRWAPGTLAGKPAYLAPEVAAGARPDVASDVFGIGAVLYQLACGRPPWSGTGTSDRPPRLVELCPQLPAGLAAAIDLALEPERLRRCRNPAKLEDDLQRVARAHGLDTGPRGVERLLEQLLPATAGAAASPAPTLVATPQAPPPRRRPGPRLLRAAIPVLAGLLLAAALWWRPSARRSDATTNANAPPRAPGTPRLVVTSGDSAGPATATPPLSAAEHSPPAPSRLARHTRPGRPVSASGANPIRETTPAKARPGSSQSAPSATPAPDAGRPEPDTPALTVVPAPDLTLDGAAAGRTLPLDRPRVLRIARGREFSARLRLEPTTTGELVLAVRSRPFAIFSIDDRPRGLTPLAGLRLGPGRHRLRLAPRGQEPARLEIVWP